MKHIPVKHTPVKQMVSGRHALLPAGLRDGLPPRAAREAAIIQRLLDVFASHGYDRIDPPLIEFESSLTRFSGTAPHAGVRLAEQLFRVADPVSQRMMAVRADITPQAARIADVRLAGQARPLRLSYGGPVLRVRGSQLRPERQFSEVGAELIGPDNPVADAEVILLAIEALGVQGLHDCTVDLNSPAIVSAMLDDLALPPDGTAAVRAALGRKDATAVAALTGDRGSLAALTRLGGPAARVLAAVQPLSMPDRARRELARLGAVWHRLQAADPTLAVTLDPVEYRGFEYQTGSSFSILASGVRGDLGRGGRFETPGGETATGFTLYVDPVIQAAPVDRAADRVYLPFDTPAATGAALRKQGLVTIAALARDADPCAEAERLGCGWIERDGRIVPLPRPDDRRHRDR